MSMMVQFLASIVSRGLRYENGSAVHGDEEFEDDAEDREATEEPVRNQTYGIDFCSSFGICRRT